MRRPPRLPLPASLADRCNALCTALFTAVRTTLATEIAHDDIRLRDHTYRAISACLVELVIALPRYRAYEVAQRWHSHSWLVDLFAWRASRSPRVQRALAGIIAETVLPGDVFSAGSLLRSLWS